MNWQSLLSIVALSTLFIFMLRGCGSMQRGCCGGQSEPKIDPENAAGHTSGDAPLRS
jgi:hypothetical protein